MTGKLQNTAICILLMGLAVLGCSLTGPAPASPTSPGAAPADPNLPPASQTTEAPNGQPAGSDIISVDNAKNLVEISTWGKGSGHHPTYSPDGKLLAVSSSSGIYLYDPQTLQEETVIAGAYGDVVDMAFSPDGKTFSVVTSDHQTYTMQRLDAASGSVLHSSTTTLADNFHDNIAALSPDGKAFATAFEDGTVKLWDAASGKELHGWSIYFPVDLAFSPDSKTLAIIAGDGTMALYAVSSGRQLRTIASGSSLANPDIISLAFSPDGRTLAAGVRRDASSAHLFGDHVTLWDVASGHELRTLSGHTSDVLAVAFSPDGRTLASGTADTIKLWDAASGNELLSISARNVEDIMFSPDGKTLVTSSSVGDNSVKLWDAAAGNLLNTLKGDNALTPVSFSPDSGSLAYASDDNTVRLRDVVSGNVHILSGHPEWVQSLAFSPDGRTLASGSTTNPSPFVTPGLNVLKLWDVAGGSELHTLSGHTGSVYSVDFSPDGKLLASGSDDGTVKLWDAASGGEVRTISTPDLVYSVAFSPDGKILASGSGDNTIKLWDTASGSELRTLSGLKTQAINLTFSPDGKELVSRSYDGNKLWDVASGQELATLSTTWSNTVISPDGKVLATGFEDGTVKVLDPATGNELYTLSGHTELVFGLAFSPDGKLLATGGDSIKLWDAASGQQLASFSMNSVYSLAFSPDGRLLLSGSLQGMSLWGVSP